MTSLEALIELVARVSARNGLTVLVNEEELSQWPEAAVAAMKSHKLLTRAGPAASVLCPGCEWEFAMPVHSVPAGKGSAAPFIVCDKRIDINRVVISSQRLNQWKCDAEAIARFVAANLGMRVSDQQSSDSGRLTIGIARGEKRLQMLSLRADGGLALVAADRALSLVELVNYCNGEFSVDAAMVRKLVDSATTADPRYTPSKVRGEARKLDTQKRHKSWQKAYRDLKRRDPKRSDTQYAQKIAKLDIAAGRSAETIRKHMKN